MPDEISREELEQTARLSGKRREPFELARYALALLDELEAARKLEKAAFQRGIEFAIDLMEANKNPPTEADIKRGQEIHTQLMAEDPRYRDAYLTKYGKPTPR